MSIKFNTIFDVPAKDIPVSTKPSKKPNFDAVTAPQKRRWLITSIVVIATADGEPVSDNYHWQELYVWMSGALTPAQVPAANLPSNLTCYGPQQSMGETSKGAAITAHKDYINLVVPADYQVKFWIEHRTNGAKARSLSLVVQGYPI